MRLALVWVVVLLSCSQVEVPSGWTRYGADVAAGEDRPVPYPRPTMRRERWQCLDGRWELAVVPRSAPRPLDLDATVRVPFPIEAPLSGAERSAKASQRVFYRRTFTVPPEWEADRVLLHFGAVDWECEVTIDGTRVGWHRGGYDAFTCDVTGVVRPGEEAELAVAVWDPTEDGGQPRGRQSRAAGTAATGIWQSVWLEPVPDVSIDRLVLDVDRRSARVSVEVRGGGRGHAIRAFATGGGVEVSGEARFDGAVTLAFEEPRPWSPEDPFLYDLRVELLDEAGDVVDAVHGALGLRDVSVEEDEAGVPRLHLNGRPVFFAGAVLDARWPDGGPTAPSDEALAEQVALVRALGFEAVSLPDLVERERFYAHCDREGVVVFQGMPAATSDGAIDRAQWRGELERVVRQRSIHPSIVAWAPFADPAGARDVTEVVQRLAAIDPSRLVVVPAAESFGDAGDVVDHGRPEDGAPDGADRRARIAGALGDVALNAGDDASLEGLERSWRKAYGTRDRLSAALFARLTDRADDATGLRTHDRRSLKFDAERLALLHDGLFPPTLAEGATHFFDATVLALATDRDDVSIRYTTDGSLPDAASPAVDAPLAFQESCVLTARAFTPKGRGSWPARFELRKIPAHAAREAEGLLPGLRARAWLPRDDRPLDAFEALDVAEADVEWTVPRFEVGATPRVEAAAVAFEGTVTVPRSGYWRFTVEAGARHRLLVDGEDVTVPDRDLAIALSSGAHDFLLLVLGPLEGLGTTPLEVLAEGPDRRGGPIPDEWLRHDPAD